MSPPRLEDDFRAAFALKAGLVHRCRDALSGDGGAVGFERTCMALLELGFGGLDDDPAAPSLSAAEDLDRVVQRLREHGSDPAPASLWRVPVAAGVDRRPGVLDPRSVGERAIAGWLELLGRWLNGTFPEDTLDVEVPVLTRMDGEGEVSMLHLRALADGPRGLYPHPTMALFYGDARFRASLADAWIAAGSGGRTVTWELLSRGRAVDHVTSGSAGGAFAVALTQLERRRTSRVARSTVRLAHALGARPHAAVSAAVHPDGSLGSVDGHDEKLKAAAKAGVKLVVLSEADREASGSGGPAGLDVEYAADVREAAKLTRGAVSRLAAASVALLVAAVLAVVVLGVENHQSAVRDQRERLARAADEALSKASAVGRDDLQLQDKLLLASSALAREAHDDDLAERALTRGATLEPGVLRRFQLALSGPVDGLVPVDDGHRVIAWSEAGHLALLDSTTGRQFGSFVEPPGDLTLTQPIPTATAALPSTGLAAFVFQNPLHLSRDGSPATLVVFSTVGRLRTIGTVDGFTTAPTNAMAYAPSGTRLLTVSGSELTVWDVTDAVPTELRTCRWRPADPGAKGAAVAIVSLGGGRPGLVLDRGQIVRLDGWDPPARPSCRGRLIAPALPDVGAADFAKHTLAVGVPAHGDPVELGVRHDGRIVVRQIARPARLIDVGPRVSAVGTPFAGQVPLQTVERHTPSLRVYDLVGPMLKLAQQYRRHTLPAVAGPDFAYALQGGRVSQLSTSRETYSPAVTSFGHGNQIIEGVAMTRHAVALAYPRSAAVFGLHDHRLDRLVTWPKPLQQASGDGRVNETFSLSDSGRYVAVVVSGGRRGRRLLLYDALHHAPIDVRAQLRRYTTAAPLDIAFEHGGEQLLVEYFDGLLLRLSPTPSGWTVQALLRGQVYDRAFGLTLGDESIFRIETKDGKGRAVRYDLEGAQKATWSLASTHASFGLGAQYAQAQLAVMNDSRAALVLDGGTAFELRDDGRLGPPISLGDGPVLDTAQIGPDKLLVARQSGTSTLHWTSGVAEETTERYGLVDAIAASPDFDLMAGSVWLTSQAVVTPLRDDVRTAVLCGSADGDLSRAAWRQFIGASVPYRPSCGSAESRARALSWLAFRSRQLPEPIGLSTPAVAQVGSLRRACAATGTASLTWVRSADRVDAPPVVCMRGRAVWLASAFTRTRVVTGGTPRQPLLLVEGRARDDPRHRANLNELVDASGNVVAEFITHGGVAGLVGDRFPVTDRVGDLLSTTTYVRDPRGAGWSPSEELPVGSATPPAGG